MAGEFLQHAEPHGCVTCLMPACMLLLEASLEQVPTHPTAPELSGQEMGGMDLPSITLVIYGTAELELQASWIPCQDCVQQEGSFIEPPSVVALGRQWWCC